MNIQDASKGLDLILRHFLEQVIRSVYDLNQETAYAKAVYELRTRIIELITKYADEATEQVEHILPVLGCTCKACEKLRAAQAGRISLEYAKA